MTDEQKCIPAIFYCQNVPESNEQSRQTLEKKYGESVRFFPVPCSGRLDPIHLLKALEEFADVAYVITCPEGTCRYFEGNQRARKRVERARSIIASIGLEEERLDIVIGSKENRKTLGKLSEEIVERISHIPPSPVHEKGGRGA